MEAGEKPFDAKLKTKSLVQRNKCLAKYGRGVLSLTDSELDRLNFLLDDSEDNKEKESEINYYTLNSILRNRLDEIESTLDASTRTLIAPEKLQGNLWKRLHEINRTLSAFKKCSNEKSPFDSVDSSHDKESDNQGS